MRKISHWLEQYSPGESLDILCDLALSHAAEGGETGKQITSLIRKGRFAELCEFEIDYDDPAQSAGSLLHCRQALAFFTKLEHLDIGVNKEAEAWRKFVSAEDACRVTNDILRSWFRGGFQFHPRVESWLFKAQRQIAAVLGPVPSLEQLDYRFGKGATTRTKKRLASLRKKFQDGVDCSEDLSPIAGKLLEEMPVLAEAFASTVVEDGDDWCALVNVGLSHGRLDFVPKNAKTYRSTVTEPVLNGLFQLALGDWMFTRLAAFGVDLRDQTRNQRLALEGSITGELATLDLSSASDTVSKELVFHLLPVDWAILLARARSSSLTYLGWTFTQEKFSSMGNGFTFPLESLIFWALTRAVCVKGETVAVYGDDIICPSCRYNDVVELLTTVGFTVNEKKSFKQGPFRESCGRDYYKGIDIRPYYQKDWVSPRSLFVLHNFYVRHSDPVRAALVRGFLHESHLIYGPEGYGDGHLLGDYPRAKKAAYYRKGFCGHTFDTFSIKAKRDIRPAQPGDFVLPSYSIYRRASEAFVDPLKLIIDHVDSNLSAGPEGGRKPLSTALARFLRGSGECGKVLDIPDYVQEDGSVVKAASLPDTEDAYKRVSIYVLST